VPQKVHQSFVNSEGKREIAHLKRNGEDRKTIEERNIQPGLAEKCAHKY